MEKHTFISDLDGTLVFSKEPTHICVERKEDKPITYMPEEAIGKLKQLLNKVEFIPCSMRNREQILRISFIKEYNPKYIIASNGCSIYIDGVLDEDWNNYMRKLIPQEEISNLINKINSFKIPTTIYNVDGFYLALTFESNKEANSYVDLFKSIVPNDDYIVFVISRKLYIMNKYIDKSYAVQYLKSKYDLGNIYTAGDTFVDEHFTALKGVKTYLPRHATFIDNRTCYITKSTGIDSVNELLEAILNDL